MENIEPIGTKKFSDTDLILKKRKIERDPEGRLILYHVTTADKLIKILKSGKLLPPNMTGEGTWSVGKENEDPEKGSKIYIGSRDFVEHHGPSHGIVYYSGGRSYLLEVHVDEENLRPDEDTRATNWLDSLDFLGSCSYKGEISNFKLVSIHDVRLPFGFNAELYSQPRTGEEKDKMIDDRIKQILEKEEKMFKDAGIDLGKILADSAK
jgi:hypothetical protein